MRFSGHFVKRGLSKAKDRRGRLFSCLGSLLTVKKKRSRRKRKKIGNFARKQRASFEAASPAEFSSERKNAGKAEGLKKSQVTLLHSKPGNPKRCRNQDDPRDNDLIIYLFFPRTR